MDQKPMSILLVEDNPADVGLLREALQEHGVEAQLTVVTDGEQAIQLIQDIESQRAACPDLFIVDLNLPKRPGREVLERMGLSKCRHAPVVVLSSSDSPRDKEIAARLGVRYICKPSRLEEFLSLGAVFKEILSDSGQ